MERKEVSVGAINFKKVFEQSLLIQCCGNELYLHCM